MWLDSWLVFNVVQNLFNRVVGVENHSKLNLKLFKSYMFKKRDKKSKKSIQSVEFLMVLSSFKDRDKLKLTRKT